MAGRIPIYRRVGGILCGGKRRLIVAYARRALAVHAPMARGEDLNPVTGPGSFADDCNQLTGPRRAGIT